MAYIKQTWIDNQSPLTADRMNHIEDGISSVEYQVSQIQGGTPKAVTQASEMTDTSLIYLYMGDEEGYESGHFYYYDGTQWEDGGEYGSSVTGISNNARNLLKYILERVAYTETGMQVYVNALYEALAQSGGGGGGTTTYTITNALDHVTNSNTATGCDEGDSYTATLTADEGYSIDTVTVTMGGVDVTSTVYNSSTGVITIASVTGDVVITAVAVVSPYLYELPSAFTSSGENSIDTGVQLTAGNTYTFLCDFTTTSFAKGTTSFAATYVFGNKVLDVNTYCALQQIEERSGTNKYTWGMGIGYSSGKNLITATHRTRGAFVMTINNDGSCSVATQLKNVTSGTAIASYSNSYATGCAITSQTYYLGKTTGDSNNSGFIGTVHDFKIYNGEMASADITDYLTNGAS